MPKHSERFSCLVDVGRDFDKISNLSRNGNTLVNYPRGERVASTLAKDEFDGNLGVLTPLSRPHGLTD
ncbi:hypothetical protein PgNI_05509, partial [Pyricularia grisea]|uniref:Uncharacterized protein n=1 Tax=Pyricularia grisea TaxID=148305 RepID=A0A6P8B644_PYRGI